MHDWQIQQREEEITTYEVKLSDNRWKRHAINNQPKLDRVLTSHKAVLGSAETLYCQSYRETLPPTVCPILLVAAHQ